MADDSAANEPKGIEKNRVMTDEQMAEVQRQAMVRAKARVAYVELQAAKTGGKG